MSNPHANPHTASQSPVTGSMPRRLTVAIAAWLAGGVLVAGQIATIVVPLPLARLMPPAPHVVARTPVVLSMETQP